MTRAHDFNRVRLRREKLGLLLVEVAARVCRPNGKPIGAPLMSMIEHGFVPKPETQERIARVLDTTPADLWPEEYQS